jgi:hypothetical protein
MKHYPKSWSRELKISLYMDDARKERLAADLERRTVKHAPLSWLGAPIAVGVIDIPIWQERAVMTTQEKIDYLKKLAPPHTVNPQSATHSNRYDPRPTFRNVAVSALFPNAGRDDFADNRVNTDDDETFESHRVGYASDLLNCQVSGEAGPGCSHGDIDHIKKAAECLRGAMDDEAQRKKNLADAARMHSVKFAS